MVQPRDDKGYLKVVMTGSRQMAQIGKSTSAISSGAMTLGNA